MYFIIFTINITQISFTPTVKCKLMVYTKALEKVSKTYFTDFFKGSNPYLDILLIQDIYFILITHITTSLFNISFRLHYLGSTFSKMFLFLRNIYPYLSTFNVIYSMSWYTYYLSNFSLRKIYFF